MTHYDTLGVPNNADDAAIKRAYRRKAQVAAPRTNEECADPGLSRALVAINKAYETLSDPAKRARYDQTGQDSPQVPLDVQARTAIMQLFAQCVEQQSDTVDLVAATQQQLHQNLERLRGDLVALPKKAAKAEKTRKRLKHNGKGANFLDDLLLQKIAECNMQIQGTELAIKVCNRALEMLTEFAFEPEQAVAVFGVWVQMGTGGFGR